jgi:hypothetical protein
MGNRLFVSFDKGVVNCKIAEIKANLEKMQAAGGFT